MKRILVQHASRGAAFDRYNTIRNFFRQQHLSPVSTLSYSARENPLRQPSEEARQQDVKPPEKDKVPPPHKEGTESVSL
ncbi:hypothetical protein V8D89_006003, partial [Ganoderma adspersum]